MIPYITQLYSGNLPYISYFIPHYSSKEWFTKGDERTNLPSERLTATVIGFMLVVGSRSLKHTHTHTLQLYLGKRALLAMFRPRPFLKHMKQQNKRVKQEPVSEERRQDRRRGNEKWEVRAMQGQGHRSIWISSWIRIAILFLGTENLKWLVMAYGFWQNPDILRTDQFKMALQNWSFGRSVCLGVGSEISIRALTYGGITLEV